LAGGGEIVRRVLVTGANRGLGLEFAQQLLALGDHVIATCRQPTKVTGLSTLATHYPSRLHILAADIADPDSIAALATEAGTLFDRLDLLINNAGVLISGEKLGTVSADSLQTSLATNAVGPFLLTQALLPLLVKGDRAIVANISSELGSIANTAHFYTPSYAISKAAQNMASVLLAHGLADKHVRVVSLHPGWVRTDMGGERAPITAAAAVSGLLHVIDHLGPGETGRYLDYKGRPLSW
jgi:NAD(P)-dependent dehydrogenase (short-subunit alcohol dehydrogenase family)